MPLGNLLALARAPTWTEHLNVQLIISPTLEAFSPSNLPHPTTLASVLVSSLPLSDYLRLITIPARAPTRAKPPDTELNTLLTLKAFSVPNMPQSTTTTSVLISILPLGNPPAPKTIHSTHAP